MRTVLLSVDDMAWARQIADRRQHEAVKDGRPDRHGYRGDGGIHVIGAAGELAVARYLGLEWEASVNTFNQPDIGGFIQVRTRSKHWYELLVRDDDSDDEVFIHVTAELPECRIHGFMIGKDAKQPQWKHAHGGREPAYFVPFEALELLE